MPLQATSSVPPITAFWWNTYAYPGCYAKRWYVLVKEVHLADTGPLSVTLVVHDVDLLEDVYLVEILDDIQVCSLDELLESLREGEAHLCPLWRTQFDEDPYGKDAYLEFTITYKHMFPRFGFERERGHHHDYQWSNEMDLLDHCQLLQRCLQYASSLGGHLSQQAVDNLSLNGPK